MSTHPAREEVDARLEAVEARMETRLVAIDGKLDRVLDKLTTVDGTARDATSASKSVKWWILGAVVSLITVVVALFALTYQAAQLTSDAYQQGRSSAPPAKP